MVPNQEEYITLQKVLDRFEDYFHSGYPASVIVEWINDLDGYVYNEIYKTHEGCPPPFRPYQVHEGHRDLLVPRPYGFLMYEFYIEAMMEHYNGDTDRYNNAISLFRDAVSCFSRYYNGCHRPLGGQRKYW